MRRCFFSASRATAWLHTTGADNPQRRNVPLGKSSSPIACRYLLLKEHPDRALEYFNAGRPPESSRFAGAPRLSSVSPVSEELLHEYPRWWTCIRRRRSAKKHGGVIPTDAPFEILKTGVICAGYGLADYIRRVKAIQLLGASRHFAESRREYVHFNRIILRLLQHQPLLEQAITTIILGFTHALLTLAELDYK